MSINFIINVSKIANRILRCGHKLSYFPETSQRYFKSTLPIGCFYYIRQDKIKNFGPPPVCHFRLSTPKNALPAAVLILLRYVMKGGAVVSGRYLRKKWQKLPQEDKEKILKKIRSKTTTITAVGVIFMGVTFLYYVNHTIEDPITKRKKFIILDQKCLNQIGEYSYEAHKKQYASSILPTTHPLYNRILKIAYALIISNLDIKEVREKIWEVIVVDEPNIKNAFVLPHGKIFVFSGVLSICANDNQLAIVLAHEIAHCILSHAAENMSKVVFVEFLLLIPTLILWTIFPDIWAIFSEWITSYITQIFIHFPFSRLIEKEADLIGLQLAAKSCFDIREGPEFWHKMSTISSDVPVEWLSTHPRHESRQHDLEEILPMALKIRADSKCPPLRNKNNNFYETVNK